MSVIQKLAEHMANGEAVVLCTIVFAQGSTPRGVGSKMLVYPDGTIYETVGGGEMENRVKAAALTSLQDGQPRKLSYNFSDPQRGDPGVCGGQIEVFVEPIIPKPTVVIVGAGHVGRAVTHLAKWLDFRVIVSDDRTEFSTPQATPGGDIYHQGTLKELPQAIQITPWTYLVLTTRGMNVDVEGLPALLDSPAAYIGVIGSRRRWALARKKMIAAGVSKEKLDRVVSPIGLELNAETPEEIAVSIMAEIIMMRRGGDGSHMKSEASTLEDIES